MGTYECDVVVVIKMGAYIHGVLILCGCLLSGFYSISTANFLLPWSQVVKTISYKFDLSGANHLAMVRIIIPKCLYRFALVTSISSNNHS